MNKLFLDNERFTDAAIHLDSELCQALSPIFKKYASLGYSIRDISHVASLAIQVEECEYILCNNALLNAIKEGESTGP